MKVKSLIGDAQFDVLGDFLTITEQGTEVTEKQGEWILEHFPDKFEIVKEGEENGTSNTA